ncbi:MAG: phosphopantetheine-binding protein [Pseudomonadota bacterium]|nr:phosphopantetheine-binding protein [Pseudomonadota bacterium]
MHGRSDGVLNIRGVRVGPAEIYRILHGIEDIVEAMAVEQQAPNEPGGSRLVLLTVLRHGVTLDAALVKRVRLELSRRGSPALVPARIVQVEALPVTHNGKRSEAAARDAVNRLPARNRDALQNPDSIEAIACHPALQETGSTAQPQAAPTDDLMAGDKLERALQRIAETVLGIAPVQWDDNLMELGADSLTVINLFVAFEELTAGGLSLGALFEAPTIESFAARSRRAGTGPRYDRAASPSALRVRPAEPADIEPLCRFLHAGFNAKGSPPSPVPSPAAWRSLFDYHWLDDKPDLGFVLTDGGAIVGFLGTVYARREIGNKTGLVCNHSSWYVRPEYRGCGAALLTEAMRERDATYTALTPGAIAQAAYDLLGFGPLGASKIMLPPLLHAGTLLAPRPRISFDPEVVRRSIDGRQRRIFDDHAPYACLQLVLAAGAEYAYVVVKRRKMPFVVQRSPLPLTMLVPYSEVLYCSAPTLLARHLERVKLAILRRQRTLALVVDAGLFPVQPRGATMHERGLFRSPLFGAGELDKLYSELVLLPV